MVARGASGASWSAGQCTSRPCDTNFETLPRKTCCWILCTNVLARWVLSLFCLSESLIRLPRKSVRYVLIDEAVVKGEGRAHYWSRSEGATFYSMLAAEEERDAREHASEESSEAMIEEPPAVAEPRPTRRRASAGSNFP